MSNASVLLLLPRALDGFILEDQARDLLRSPGVVAIGPARIPFGAYGRVPESLVPRLARAHARLLRGSLPASPRVVVIFHPLQLPLAEALLEGGGPAHPELWYARWDRYEEALDASPAQRERLATLNRRAWTRAALVFAANGALAVDDVSRVGGDAVVVGLAADSFPAPYPGTAVIAMSLGHLGRRVDWALLRGVAEAMPELVLLLVGELHPDEMAGDADFEACRALPGLVFLGRRSDEEAARLALTADCGIVPFARNPFNDGGLPYRILKLARLGRATVVPSLPGVDPWDRAVVRADGVDAWVGALRAQAGRRTAPDLALRSWALEQTAEHVNAPLWARLEELGVADRP